MTIVNDTLIEVDGRVIENEGAITELDARVGQMKYKVGWNHFLGCLMKCYFFSPKSIMLLPNISSDVSIFCIFLQLTGAIEFQADLREYTSIPIDTILAYANVALNLGNA